MKPSISVVIPAFRAELYLGAAIESVLGQTVPVDEIIVVDDGSPDGTAAVAERYSNRGVRLIRQANQGAAGARNTGIDQVTQEWLSFLDADDLWPAAKLECQLAAARTPGAPELIFGQLVQFHSPDLTAEERAQIRGGGITGPAIFASGMLLRTEHFRRVGGFLPHLKVGEFVEWYQRAGDRGMKSLVLDRVVLHRRLHRDNLTRRTQDKRAFLLAIKAGLDRRRTTSEGGPS